jgi:hypothetical protein
MAKRTIKTTAAIVLSVMTLSSCSSSITNSDTKGPPRFGLHSSTAVTSGDALGNARSIRRRALNFRGVHLHGCFRPEPPNRFRNYSGGSGEPRLTVEQLA